MLNPAGFQARRFATSALVILPSARSPAGAGLTELEERLDHQLRRRLESAVGQEHPFTDQGVDVGMRMNELPKGLDRTDGPRHGVRSGAHRLVT
jgi:hypothetical protein